MFKLDEFNNTITNFLSTHINWLDWQMSRRIFCPFTKVNRRDNGALARNTGITGKKIYIKGLVRCTKNAFKQVDLHFVIRKDHWVYLNGVNQIGIVANDP